jgi:gas vesicle protein
MLPKNLLVNLLYRYKLVKQAALNDHIKKAYSEQLQRQYLIQQLLDLYRANFLVKKAGLLNDLYRQAVLVKLANPEDLKQQMDIIRKFKDNSEDLIKAIRGKGAQITFPALEKAILSGELNRNVVKGILSQYLMAEYPLTRLTVAAERAYPGISKELDPGVLEIVRKTHSDFPHNIKAVTAPPTSNIAATSSTAGTTATSPAPEVPKPATPTTGTASGAPPGGGGSSTVRRGGELVHVGPAGGGTTGAPPGGGGSSTVRRGGELVHVGPAETSRFSQLRQRLGAVASKLKPSRAGLIGSTIGAIAAALPSLYVGSRMGRSSSSAYERGKTDALSNLTEEKLRAILEQNKVDALKNLTGDQLKALLEQIKKQSIQA